MAERLTADTVPHLSTFTSSAARLCQAASKAGLDLSGAQLEVGGEPLTETLLEVIQSSGAKVGAVYGSMETGSIAYSCLRREWADDSHVFDDLYALIQPGESGRERHLTPTALLTTSLRITAPFILLNASMGDQAELVSRSCGCELQQLGWTRHLHTIRSFEKLTAGGMTFFDTDVIRVLEKLLPARFGGGITDYQLVEEEATDGQPQLRLLVHPSVGALDPHEVADAFLTMIGSATGSSRVMELQWRQSGLLRVERRPPIAGTTGKILHLHKARGQGALPG